MPKQMEISIIGNVIELRREQWKGKVARITNDSALLEEVKKYTWTYKDGEHPYLHNSKLNLYFHDSKQFQLQLFMNDDIYFTANSCYI